MVRIDNLVLLTLTSILLVSSNGKNNKPSKDNTPVNLKYFKQNFEIEEPYFQINHISSAQKINPAIFNACYGDYDTVLNKSTQYSTYLKMKYEENIMAIQNRIKHSGIFPCPGPSLAQSSSHFQVFSHLPYFHPLQQH